MLLLVNGQIMEPLCVCWFVSTGGVPELHQGAAGEWKQAVYLWNQCLHPHLHQPDGMKFLLVATFSNALFVITVFLMRLYFP